MTIYNLYVIQFPLQVQAQRFRITSRNICASDEAVETASTVLLQPWNAATIFSAGIT